ncbi:WD40/YVTN/BNR-like repeat-containing protein [Tumebacillus flagellatus]|uniref:Photosynthesis system II assembly factor Ycf48/Hcf136-like domain-containing protein n=1 Tax=Tumebacillus flagellatus TaxID=1157490 RepID=A0A074LMJ8_9BACL|nr:hypothetical protein [Tumebacillus flagellatus]KEO81088.1 hypothetical protein EL26_22590 [Tumebacillus flagellatus]
MNKKMTYLAMAAALAVALTGCGQKTMSPAAPTPPSNQQQIPEPAPAPAPATTPAPTTPTSSQPADPAHQTYDVKAVEFGNPTSGWVGGKGFILNTTDGGRSWNVQYSGPYEIEKLSFLNPFLGWALGHDGEGDAGGVVMQTTDGGKHWNEVSHPKYVHDLHFVSETTGIASGQITHDGGKTWQVMNLPSEPVLGEPALGNETRGWVVTSEGNSFTVQHTIDGGKTWTKVFTRTTMEPPVTASIQATNADDAWVTIIGGTGMTQTSYSVFHTADNGEHWNPVIAQSTAGGGTAPGYDTPNTSPSGPATKPGYVEAINSQTAVVSGFCAACGYGTISTGNTLDGGKTWSNFKQSLPGSGGQLSFVNQGQGWMIVSSYEKPPVLYYTENTGQTWTKEFVFGPGQ